MPPPVVNLHDPLVKRIVQHVFNKHRADVETPRPDGTVKFTPAKKKYRLTRDEILTKYGIDVPASAIKLANAGASVSSLSVVNSQF